MSTILEKSQAIQKVAAQIHTGAEALGSSKDAVKLFVSKKVTSATPATTFAYTHTESEVLLLSGLTGATTLNLTAGDDLQFGDTLTIEVTQDGTGRNLVFGTGVTADTLTGVANDVDVVILQYVAVDTWILISNTKTVDAA